jgi:hypothetical protein
MFRSRVSWPLIQSGPTLRVHQTLNRIAKTIHQSYQQQVVLVRELRCCQLNITDGGNSICISMACVSTACRNACTVVCCCALLLLA